MTRLLFCLSLIVGGLVSVRVAAAGGAISEGRFYSDLLDRPYHYTIYLPEGYATDACEYPAVYLLHGSFGTHWDWVRKGKVRETADRLIREGTIPPAILVMPGSESWWIDGYNEQAGTAFLEELIPYIENRYRVIPKRGWRGVAGLSAGGYGAVNFALSRPDLFGAAAAFSPASYHPLPPENSSAWRHPAFTREGEFDAELWTRQNYTAHLDSYSLQAHTVPLYISAGNRDPFGAVDYALTLETFLAPHQAGDLERQTFPGGHTWRVWRASLPAGLSFMFRYLGEPC